MCLFFPRFCLTFLLVFAGCFRPDKPSPHAPIVHSHSSTLPRCPQVAVEEFPSVGKKEQSQPERRDWQDKSPSSHPKEKHRAPRGEDRQEERHRAQEKEKATHNESDDFERTPSGRVRRRSAQVAVFHLQEIAEDELAKDWGTKRRIKDDLVPDSKRVS